MGCKSCTTGGCGTKNAAGAVKGCKNNGACGTGGCNKMNVFDWLSNMETPSTRRYDAAVEVKFKGGRKEYFRNPHQLDLTTGDFVVCEMQTGYHIGCVSLQGELVRLQMLKKNIPFSDDLKVIHRVASQKDLEKHEQAIARDLTTMYRTREVVKELKLNMKLSDVEYQSDNTKATFYYSSDERVDFRELIKILAAEFKIRVEMRQISLRQEAGRLGGIGSCGRELCCSTWLTDFKNITTSAARYQNLSLNPSKLSGQCGRLKCCLNYELETYVDALRDIPQVEKPLETQKGRASLQKTDIFRRIMWFGYSTESTWYPLPVERVMQIQELNKKGIIPESFDLLEPVAEKKEGAKGLTSLNSDLEKLDKKFSDRSDRKKKRKKKKPSGTGGGPAANPAASNGRPEKGKAS
ncbi:stage 0 sporulation family protein [Larkinella insperata]|uniref:Stage 0 sporulation family protein n=1 Tax=Larkinella insperata TaxID=332158 RepID=A0ABW3Q5R1_9BACT|nr:regulatory iron-sulfur-containing complex subunit RicT [Larkinella insperata]